MEVPIPAMILPSTIMAKFLAPDWRATPTRRIMVPRVKAYRRPTYQMNHQATNKLPMTLPKLTVRKELVMTYHFRTRSLDTNLLMLATTPTLELERWK